MLPNKRVRKPPQKFVPSNSVKKKQVEESKQGSSEDFEYIPFPNKYNDIEDVFVLYASLSLSRQDNKFFFDFGLLNTFYSFSNIEVIEIENEKVVVAKCEKKAYTRFNRWATVLNKVSNTKDLQLKEWVSLIKEYCRVFEKQMNKYMKENEKLLKSPEDEQKIVKREAQEDHFGNLPCALFKSHFTGHQERLIEVTVNKKMIEKLGYDIESFICHILREGFPSILVGNASNSDLIQTVLNDYISAKNIEYQSCELDCRLVTKNGYLRDSRARISILPVYENGRYEINTILSVLDIFIVPNFLLEAQVFFAYNEEFVELMSLKESEAAEFLKRYYDHVIHKKYSNHTKICKIKELDNLKLE